MKTPQFIVTETPIGPGETVTHGPCNYDWACWLAVGINLGGKSGAVVSPVPNRKRNNPNPSTADQITALHRELDEYAGD